MRSAWAWAGPVRFQASLTITTRMSFLLVRMKQVGIRNNLYIISNLLPLWLIVLWLKAWFYIDRGAFALICITYSIVRKSQTTIFFFLSNGHSVLMVNYLVAKRKDGKMYSTVIMQISSNSKWVGLNGSWGFFAWENENPRNKWEEFFFCRT